MMEQGQHGDVFEALKSQYGGILRNLKEVDGDTAEATAESRE